VGLEKLPHRLHVTRDLVLFSVGTAGIIFETLSSQHERPTLLALFAGMVGLPVFLRLDGKKDKDEKGQGYD
jgi:hypothetical protein